MPTNRYIAWGISLWTAKQFETFYVCSSLSHSLARSLACMRLGRLLRLASLFHFTLYFALLCRAVYTMEFNNTFTNLVWIRVSRWIHTRQQQLPVSCAFYSSFCINKQKKCPIVNCILYACFRYQIVKNNNFGRQKSAFKNRVCYSTASSSFSMYNLVWRKNHQKFLQIE